ncbi:hypothetical protein AC629_41865 [Bradyrhizobium sp. NAS80.1]|uniref:hypothetical protein n=1 Tax=Bradyrhizobium sp. NAS80.1 TaxID=1680159 RepID=UPI00095AB097|nr:hypothetical protein [Bradyrhizobium sp. NAS80.1]OKO68788.1 hypothetical protein AC629_41865 [Bradyrhizobium sp. NAS80.1]
MGRGFLGFLTLATLAMTTFAAADGKSFEDKIKELKKAGYVELSGAQAVDFLVGNSAVKHDDRLRKGQTGAKRPQINYYPNNRVWYRCGGSFGPGCSVQSWDVENAEICFSVDPCDDAPTILKAPHSNSDKLGLMIYDQGEPRYDIYDIVKGNQASAPLFDDRFTDRVIELDRVKPSKEIREADTHTQDGVISISGSRGISFLVGNTFLSNDVAGLSKEQGASACPEYGTYYSPDGDIISFTCQPPPSRLWTISVLHWKLQSGAICGKHSTDLSKCALASLTATLAPEGPNEADGKLRVQDRQNGVTLTGYAGNVFNFRFENRLDSERSSGERPER